MVDFHCHLDLHEDPHSVIQECRARGVRVLSVTTTPRAWDGSSALAQGSENVLTALGIHPQLVKSADHELSLFRELLDRTRFVGEIGIDGSADFSDTLDEQKSLFSSALKSCESIGGRILSIHSRNASCEVLNEIERTVKTSTPVLHWFSGTMADLERAVTLGCWFSVGPPMFYSAKGMKLIRAMPRERILTESDSPFASLKSVRILPWDVAEHLGQLGDILGLNTKETMDLIESNLEQLLQDRV